MANYNSQLGQAYGNSLNNVNYKGAISHYKKLKEKFVKECELQTENNQFLNNKEIITNFEELVHSTSSKQDEKGALKVLNTIFEHFTNTITSDQALQTLVTEAKEKIAAAQLDIHSSIEEEKNRINKILYGIVDKQKQSLQSALTKTIMEKHTGAAADDVIKERYDAFLAKTNQITVTALKAILRDKQTFELYGRPAATLSGYIKEDLEYEALKKIFSQTELGKKIQVKPGGNIKAGEKSKATHLDNIISNIDYIEKEFNQQINMTTNLSSYINLEQLLSNIKYYGEQVKTFSLLNTRSSSPEFLGKRISENKALFNSWITAEQNEKYSVTLNLYRNIRFLEKTPHTLAAFGPETLIMATGDGRFFTDEFIKYFFKQEYYLMFAHSTQADKDWLPTIVLDRPWVKKNYSRKKVYASYRDLV